MFSRGSVKNAQTVSQVCLSLAILAAPNCGYLPVKDEKICQLPLSLSNVFLVEITLLKLNLVVLYTLD